MIDLDDDSVPPPIPRDPAKARPALNPGTQRALAHQAALGLRAPWTSADVAAWSGLSRAAAASTLIVLVKDGYVRRLGQDHNRQGFVNLYELIP